MKKARKPKLLNHWQVFRRFQEVAKLLLTCLCCLKNEYCNKKESFSRERGSLPMFARRVERGVAELKFNLISVSTVAPHRFAGGGADRLSALPAMTLINLITAFIFRKP